MITAFYNEGDEKDSKTINLDVNCAILGELKEETAQETIKTSAASNNEEKKEEIGANNRKFLLF